MVVAPCPTSPPASSAALDPQAATQTIWVGDAEWSTLIKAVGVADPYNWIRIRIQDMNKIRYGSGSRPNFDTDQDPGKNNTDSDPGKKRINYQEKLQKLIKT